MEVPETATLYNRHISNLANRVILNNSKLGAVKVLKVRCLGKNLIRAS